MELIWNQIDSIKRIVSQNRCKINPKWNQIEFSLEDAMAQKSISIRMDEEVLHKLHVVSDYWGRSANSQVVFMIKKVIEEYEAKHGKIELGEKKKPSP